MKIPRNLVPKRAKPACCPCGELPWFTAIVGGFRLSCTSCSDPPASVEGRTLAEATALWDAAVERTCSHCGELIAVAELLEHRGELLRCGCADEVAAVDLRLDDDLEDAALERGETIHNDRRFCR
jgi:hypothetical protein